MQDILKQLAKFQPTAKVLFITAIIAVIFLINKWPGDSVLMRVCDVGQGDAVLIQQGFLQIIIDSGPNERVLTCLREAMPLRDRVIELLILTHYDTDHIGGMPHLLQNYRIRELWLPTSIDEVMNHSPNLHTLLSTTVDKSLTIKQPILGDSVRSIFGLSLSVLYPFDRHLVMNEPPNGEAAETLLSAQNDRSLINQRGKNDGSIVIYAQYGNLTALLMGDASERVEAALAADGLISQVKVLKVGHHGSKTSSSTLFLNLAKPEIAVISCGKNNRYLHPDATVVNRLGAVGAQVLRTDQQGTINIETNGSIVWLTE